MIDPRDITLWRLAERYASEPDLRTEMDHLLGVYHIPMHPEGECELCDAERERTSKADSEAYLNWLDETDQDVDQFERADEESE